MGSSSRRWLNQFTHVRVNLAIMLKNGDGAPRDDRQAFGWFLKAAEAGDARSQYEIGLAFEDGRGTERNDSQAFGWYRKAVDNRRFYFHALPRLGAFSAEGRGTTADLVEASKWYLLSQPYSFRQPDDGQQFVAKCA